MLGLLHRRFLVFTITAMDWGWLWSYQAVRWAIGTLPVLPCRLKVDNPIGSHFLGHFCEHRYVVGAVCLLNQKGFALAPLRRGRSELQPMTRRRAGHPIEGELRYDRVSPLAVKDHCDPCPGARFNAAAPYSNQRMRWLASRSLADSAELIPGLTPF